MTLQQAAEKEYPIVSEADWKQTDCEDYHTYLTRQLSCRIGYIAGATYAQQGEHSAGVGESWSKEDMLRAYNYFRYRDFPHNTNVLEFEDFLLSIKDSSKGIFVAPLEAFEITEKQAKEYKESVDKAQDAIPVNNRFPFVSSNTHTTKDSAPDAAVPQEGEHLVTVDKISDIVNANPEWFGKEIEHDVIEAVLKAAGLKVINNY